MAQSAVVTILGVEQKSGTGKNGKPYTIHKVKASDGNQYDTFDAPLYQAAVQAGGAPVVLEYEARQNGEYTNYDLRGVSLAGNQAPVASPVVAPSPAPVGLDPATQVATIADPSTYAQDKDARITRLSAARTAFDYASANGLDSFSALALAKDVERFANTGLGINEVSDETQEEAPVAAAPQAGALPWDDA